MKHTKLFLFTLFILSLAAFSACSNSSSSISDEIKDFSSYPVQTGHIADDPFRGSSWYGESYDDNGAVEIKELLTFKTDYFTIFGQTFGHVETKEDVVFSYPENYNGSNTYKEMLLGNQLITYTVEKKGKSYSAVISILGDPVVTLTISHRNSDTAVCKFVKEAYVSYGSKTWYTKDLLPRTLTRK